MKEQTTAARIASAALAILIDEGADAVTMRRVAAGAGVSAMATYRHFPSREALLHTVADDAFAELGRAWGRRHAADDFDGRIAGLRDDFLDFALGQPNLYTFLVTERRAEVRRFPDDFRAGESPAFGPVVEVVEQGMRDGALRPDDPVEVALAITMPTVGLMQLYLGGRIGLSESDFRELCVNTTRRILDGLRG